MGTSDISTLRDRLLAARAEIDRLLDALPSEATPQHRPEPPRFMTPQDFATHMHVSLRTVQAWTANGLPAIRIRRQLRIEVRVAEEWLRLNGARKPNGTSRGA